MEPLKTPQSITPTASLRLSILILPPQPGDIEFLRNAPNLNYITFSNPPDAGLEAGLTNQKQGDTRSWKDIWTDPKTGLEAWLAKLPPPEQFWKQYDARK